MPGYLIANYNITNPDAFAAYPVAAGPTLAPYGAKVLVADYATNGTEGAPGHVTIVLEFPSKADAEAWYASPEYQKIIGLRTQNSQGFLVICEQFVTPEG